MNQKEITDKDIERSNIIASTLYNDEYLDYILMKNGYNLTKTYSKIIEKSKSEFGIKSYINYVLNNRNSPEEQLCYSLESIFASNPASVLKIIKNENQQNREFLIGSLVLPISNIHYTRSKDNFRQLFFQTYHISNIDKAKYSNEIELFFSDYSRFLGYSSKK